MSDPPRRVAVTGASGYVGDRLVRRLENDVRVRHILALDVRPPQTPFGLKVDFQLHDISRPLADLFSRQRIDSAVHLAFLMRPERNASAAWRVNVGGTQNLLAAGLGSGVRSIIYLSSTTVYGAHPDNPPMMTEESPVRPIKGFQYSEHKAESERLLQRFSQDNPEVSVAILRCCPVMGPGADNFVSRALLKPVLVAVRGHDPPLQLIHEDDVTEAIAGCLLQGGRGTYNLAGRGVLPWGEMARTLEATVVTLPAFLLYPLTEAAWRLRLQNESPARGLDLVRFRWTVKTDRAERELGVRPRHTSREAWEAFVRHHKMVTTAPSSRP